MNYELALKLKDAGFPQHEEEVPRFVCVAFGCWLAGDEYGYENTHNPTLEELIEACGDATNGTGFLMLAYIGANGFVAEGRLVRELGWIKHIKQEGSTRTEAVANLWLALKDQENIPPDSVQ